MRIINGKKFYKKDIDAAVQLPCVGWNHYNGQNYQWYTLSYNPDCDLVILSASNSGDCYGDYATRYWDSPKAFRMWAENPYRDDTIEELLGDIDEDNDVLMKFVNALYEEE